MDPAATNTTIKPDIDMCILAIDGSPNQESGMIA
jgi:hypothetical protein